MSQPISHPVPTACVNVSGTLTTVDTILGYDPADPYAVTLTFPTSAGDVVWTFARDLLSRGLTSPAGEGDVHIWPCVDSVGRATLVIELCSLDGELVTHARAQDIHDFINHSLAKVPAGSEHQHMFVDRLIDQLLQPRQ